MNIPITFDCAGANFLRDIKKRIDAFPFDWNIKSNNSMIKIINDDFKDLFNNDYLVFGNKSVNHKYDNEPNKFVNLIPVFNKKYNILFVHDFTKDIDINIIRDKYSRRINRFIDYISNKNDIIFYYRTYELKYKQKIYSHWKEYFDDKNILDASIDELALDASIDELKNTIIKKYNNINVSLIRFCIDE